MNWREWGSDSVVFEARSGQLMQVDALAAAVMACIEAQPSDIADIVNSLAADLDLADPDELQGAVTAVIAQFHRLGWVAPIIS